MLKNKILVKTCEKISWNEVEKLNEIMPEIRTTTVSFDNANQKLRQFERRFLDRLSELEKLSDLVSHEVKWGQGLNDIRSLCKSVEDEYGSQNSLAWLQDCEKRVGDVLNVSYRVVLQKCHKQGQKWLKLAKKLPQLTFLDPK